MDRSVRSTAEGFRPDLEGLRGVAILLVLLFHAGIPGTNGGFVGVDVFFVLSGFLITGLLLRERERTGEVDLVAFYARRARRILPAALVALAGTLALARAVLGPLDMERIAADAFACTAFVGNMRFAATTADYFTAAQSPSPLLHYWSLGVEEQWYLLWPVVLLAATRIGRPRLGAGVALAAVGTVSLGIAIVLTGVAPTWAFYSLPTRAWQLALGGLLAVTVAWHERIPDRLAAAAGWAGLAAVLASLGLIDSSTPYPGLAALLPTLGAAAVVTSGSRPASPALVLTTAPLRFLGRISYSLYLIHWPLLVLPSAGLPIGETLPLAERLGLAGLAVMLATLSYRFVEEPIRRGRWLGLPARPTLAAAGAGVAAVLLVSAGLGAESGATLAAYSPASAASAVGVSSGGDDADLPSRSPGTDTPTEAGAAGASSGAEGLAGPLASTGPQGATGSAGPASAEAIPSPSTASSAVTPTPAVTPSPTPAIAGPRPTLVPVPPPAGPQPLSRSIRPPLAAAGTDWEPLVSDGCTLGDAGTAAHACVFGDPEGAKTVALVGDSHAAQWFPAVERIALAEHWRLVTYTKISCRFFDLPIYSRVEKREYTECETWRPNVVAALRQLRPDLVVVSVAGGMQPMVPADDDPARQGVALGRLLAGVSGAKAVVVDTPQSVYDVPACLADHLADTRPCRTSRAVALSWRHLRLERAAVAAMPGATLVDMTDAICPGDPCPVVLDGTIVYRDVFHLTATFAASLAATLEARLPRLGPTVGAAAPMGAAVPSGASPTPGVAVGAGPDPRGVAAIDRPAVA